MPGVEEVSAAIDLTDTYTITSDKIQSSQMLADIWVKDNGDIPSVLMHNASKGTLNTTVCALPDDELRRIAADAGVSDEEIETLLAGDSVLPCGEIAIMTPLRMNIIRASNRMAVRWLNRFLRPETS